MDSTEKKETTAENSELNEDAGAKAKGKRLRIKDTRKVDYNRTTPTSRPYQPMFGQTKQSPPIFKQQSHYQQDGDDASPRYPRADAAGQEEVKSYSDEGYAGGGYQRSTFNRKDQSSYQPKSFGNQGGYQPRRSYDKNQDSGGYQPRRSYDGNSDSGYQPRRSYDSNPDSGYQPRRSYDSNREGGYQPRRSYDGNREGGYQPRKSYGNQGGYQQQGYSQGGGYPQKDGYGPGGNQPRKPGFGGQAKFKPKPFARGKQPIKPFFPKPVKYDEVVENMSDPIRLNKYLANAGVCSRREADEFIQAGAVKVNGEVITELGSKITRLDKVTFHDQPVQIESKIYIVLNKPKNCVTTSDDPQNRQTVMDLVKNACSERIYPVGRLDRNTTGVLLLTNDGEMAAKLTHPSYKKKKIYHVWLDREVAVEDMEKLANGIELEDGEVHADAISYANEEDKSQVGIEIHSGKNRIVRRMFEALSYHAIRLDRVYFAGLTKRNLGHGKWRYLTEQEVNALRLGAYE
jgi:23S rRNA pseudouridine2605 synthase